MNNKKFKIRFWHKIFCSNRNITTPYYWKLKELFGKDFKIGWRESSGGVLRRIRVCIAGEWETIIITENFSEKSICEAREIMNNIWKVYYYNLKK